MPPILPRGQQDERTPQARQMLGSGSESKILRTVERAGVPAVLHVGGCG